MEKEAKISIESPVVKAVADLLKRIATFGMQVNHIVEQAGAEAEKNGKDMGVDVGIAITLIGKEGNGMLGDVTGIVEGGKRVIDEMKALGIDMRDLCDCPKCQMKQGYKAAHGGAEMPDATVDYVGAA